MLSLKSVTVRAEVSPLCCCYSGALPIESVFNHTYSHEGLGDPLELYIGWVLEHLEW